MLLVFYITSSQELKLGSCLCLCILLLPGTLTQKHKQQSPVCIWFSLVANILACVRCTKYVFLVFFIALVRRWHSSFVYGLVYWYLSGTYPRNTNNKTRCVFDSVQLPKVRAKSSRWHCCFSGFLYRSESGVGILVLFLVLYLVSVRNITKKHKQHNQVY